MSLTVSAFLDQLKAAPESELRFEYATAQFVPKAYHITEVKNVHIDSVDCGGRPDSYDQTIVQLWIKDGEVADRHMSTDKALKIFDIVERMKPLKPDSPIFFEWGTPELRTSVYAIDKMVEEDHLLTFQLKAPAPVCKPALEVLEMVTEGESCGSGGCC